MIGPLWRSTKEEGGVKKKSTLATDMESCRGINIRPHLVEGFISLFEVCYGVI
jgi:hypothetical protein